MKGRLSPLVKLLGSMTLLLLVGSVSSQSNPSVIRHQILVNEIIVDTIQSQANFNQPQLVPQPNADYTYNAVSLGGMDYEITITFNAGVVGNRNLLIKYFKPSFPVSQEAFISYEIQILPTLVDAKDDYISKSSDDFMIAPLANDYTTAGSPTLKSINQVKYGNASIVGDSIHYIGSEPNDIILYSISDSLGHTKQASIYVYSEDNTYAGNDTIYYSLTNSQHQLLILPNTSFIPQTSPNNGTLSAIASKPIFTYTPSTDYIGVETLVFEDTQGNSLTYIFTVLDWSNDNGYIKNDAVNTGIGQTIVIDAYKNDLVKTGILTFLSPELTHLGNGRFSYTPPAGFVGVKKFKYTKNFFFVQETGDIQVTVGNMEPLRTIAYHFDVIKNQPYIIDYKVPLNGYEFTVLNQPMHGSVVGLSNGDSITNSCFTTSGIDGFIYTPPVNFTGYDEFDMEYCINGTGCKTYKLRFTVHQPEVDSLCPCVGDCVWSGDANADGRVSVSDLLSVGRYMGYGSNHNTPIEQGVWTGQGVDDWFGDQINGKNTKHVDTNFDGVVSENDITEIYNNYRDVHTLVPEEILTKKEYPISLIPQSTQVDSGDLLVIDIVLGNATYPAKDIHGLTFGFNFNPNIMDSASFDLVFFDNTWFTNNSPTLDMIVHYQEGKIDVGYTRTNGLGATGAGILGQLSFIVEEDAHGIKTSEILEKITEYIYLTNAIMEDGFGNKFRLPDTHAAFDINLKGGQTSVDVKMFPNPADQVVTLYANGADKIQRVLVTDLTGHSILDIKGIDARSYQAETFNFNQGMYIVTCYTDKGISSQKLTIIH